MSLAMEAGARLLQSADGVGGAEAPELAASSSSQGAPSAARIDVRRTKRRKLFNCLIVASVVGLLLSIIGYLTIPQLMINRRLSEAHVLIDECVLEIGPNATSSIKPSLRFTVSKEVMQLPFVSLTANVGALHASVFYLLPDTSEEITLGKFESDEGIYIDSNEDMEAKLAGKMTITETDALPQLVNLFLKQETIVVGGEAKVDIYAKVFGKFPFVLYGIRVKKSMAIPAIDGFNKKRVELDQLLEAKGIEGELNVTAIALVFNPTPVTVIVRDSFQMQVFYECNHHLVNIATVFVVPTMTLQPQGNAAMGKVVVRKTPENEDAIQAFIHDYIGPQNGFTPAGDGPEPLLVTMTDDGEATSTSELIRKATAGLSIQINFRPKPIYFLSAITADIVALSSLSPPFYTVIVHLLVKNPVPASVYLKRVQLTAYHLNLQGRVLYHYNHDVKLPKYDPSRYVLPANKEMTVDFPLNVLSEVSWDFLLSPSTIVKLIKEAASMNVTLGVALSLHIAIDNGYEQELKYDNNALSGILCFHAMRPKENCGGLPPMPGR